MYVFLPQITAAANTLPAFVSSLRSSGYVPDSRLHQDEFVTRLGGSNTKIGSCSKSSRRSQFEMGVKGVAAYLRKNKLKGESETLKQGDTLLIDGLGWAHFLLGSTGRVDHGGDYDVIHDIASRELRRLQERGINVCVFKDGNNIHAMKIMEAGSRTAGLVEQYARLHGETGGATPRGYPYRSGDAGVGGGVDTKSSGESADESRRDGPESRGSALAASMAGESGTMPSPELNLEIDSIEWIRQAQGSRQETRGLPRPRLLTQQLFATVKEAGVELVSCSGEADLQLARASAEDSTNRTFVLGTDNDFFFFSGCRYITLGSLEFTDDAVTAPVWTRAHLAHLLELSEAQAVEWALLVGNDFTNAIYNEAMFHALPEMMLRRGRLPRETLWWLRNQSAGFRIKADPWRTCESGLGTVSDAEFADLALDFSRALYELEPLENLIGDLGGGLDGLPRTSDTSSSEGQTDPVSRETESVGSGAGAEAHDAGLKHGDGEARCADAVGQELTGSMWAPFRDAPASLAGIASSYRCSAPREDGAGESHGVEGYAFDAVKDADKDGDHGPVRQKNGTLSSMGCLDNPELVARILERPWGNVVLEAIRATVAPQESEDETWVEADEAQTVALVWCALGKRKRLDDDAKLAWRDIVIALNYQGHLWRLYREYRSENPSSKAPMPCAHFHGPTFHAAARDFRRFAESRARAVEQRREESDSSTQSEGYGSAGSTLSSGFGQEPSGEDESVRLPYVGEVRRESEGGEKQVDERPLPVAVDDCRAVAAR